MSKRNSDGDVVSNKISLMLANHQRLIDSIHGSGGKVIADNEARARQATDEDLEDERLGPAQAGIGSKMLKEIEDGTFGRRTLTSEDKLLEQILGSKAARAHRATKQAPKEPGKPQKFQRSASTSKPIESEDEEEGRSSVFRAKKTKKAKTGNTAARSDAEEMGHEVAEVDISPRPPRQEEEASLNFAEDNRMEEPDGNGRVDEPPTSSKLQQKNKPKSFLDEILAERSNKKEKKKKRLG